MICTTTTKGSVLKRRFPSGFGVPDCKLDLWWRQFNIKTLYSFPALIRLREIPSVSHCLKCIETGRSSWRAGTAKVAFPYLNG